MFCGSLVLPFSFSLSFVLCALSFLVRLCVLRSKCFTLALSRLIEGVNFVSNACASRGAFKSSPRCSGLGRRSAVQGGICETYETVHPSFFIRLMYRREQVGAMFFSVGWLRLFVFSHVCSCLRHVFLIALCDSARARCRAFFSRRFVGARCVVKREERRQRGEGVKGRRKA